MLFSIHFRKSQNFAFSQFFWNIFVSSDVNNLKRRLFMRISPQNKLLAGNGKSVPQIGVSRSKN